MRNKKASCEICCYDLDLIESWRQDSNQLPSAPKALDQQNATADQINKWWYNFFLRKDL